MGTAPKQWCFLSSPEYQRTFRGKYLFAFQARGTLILAEDELVFRRAGWDHCLPFWRIVAVGLGRFPWWSRPFLRYIEVKYAADEHEGAVWLTPTCCFGIMPWTNRIVIRWYGWLVDALRKYRERV